MKLANLKIALRYFQTSGRFTMLNVAGLTVGISLFVMMAMLLNYELSYDNIHQNRKEILQICEHDLKSGIKQVYSAQPLPATLKKDFAEVKYVAGIWQILYSEDPVKYNELEYSGFTGAVAEPDIFNIFSYHLLLGNKNDILTDPEKIAVSESFAHKLFGTENPVGKSVSVNNNQYTISHIFSDLPENSTARFDVLFSDKVKEKLNPQYTYAWWDNGLRTYVLLSDHYPLEEFNKHLNQIPDRYYPDFLKGRSTYFASPFYKSHFNTSLVGQPSVSYMFIILMGSVALVILIIACINYISLTLARAFKMNVDAGIRRIAGAHPRQIISLQIYFSSLNVFAGFLLALPVIFTSLPFFASLSERPLMSQINNSTVWALTVATLLVLALISGTIPGLIFSRIVPATMIRSKNSVARTKKGAHSSMMIFQFSLAIALIISQIFILKQISFMKNADLGYDNENLLAIEVGNIDQTHGDIYGKVKLYKAELEKQGARLGLSTGSVTENIPGFYYQNTFTAKPDNANIDECVLLSTSIDENFLRVFGIPMREGRYFSDKFSTDGDAFIINETAMKQFGWKDLDGKYLKLAHENNKYPVIGVMNDIHPTTLKDPIPAMAFRYGPHNNFPAFLTFKINPAQKAATIAFMQKTWETIVGTSPFLYQDVKETYYKNYTEEQRLAKIVGTFAVLAVFLNLLGLLGLITFYSESRIKEIGIRKVNGAKISQVVALLNKDFLWLVGISFLISCPVAWYAINKWLQNFAYKTTISWWVFIVAGLLALTITIITVSLQSWRAATRNPVESLRYE
ncbi:MAG TPA: ABC transporter permease [Bacteroidales bacterium]|nr:ABC transporter permease [Bacteroidales bacterium]